MKNIILIIVLLFTGAAQAEERSVSAPALQTQLGAVERQMVLAGVPQDDVQRALMAMEQARFTHQQIVQAGTIVQSTSRPDIAGTAVLNKIHEGIAKGIPSGTILMAATRVSSRFNAATQLAAALAGADDTALIHTYADCLAAGLQEQHAFQINSALKTRTANAGTDTALALTQQTLLTARAMVRRNISSESVAGLLQSALSAGYTDRGMIALRQHISLHSTDLETSVQRLNTALRQGVHADELGSLNSSGWGAGQRSGSGGQQGGSSGGSGSSGGGSSGGGSGSGGSGGSSGGGNGGGGGGNGGGGRS